MHFSCPIGDLNFDLLNGEIQLGKSLYMFVYRTLYSADSVIELVQKVQRSIQNWFSEYGRHYTDRPQQKQ